MKSMSQKGFTLLEVLIVIALIAIMTTIAGYYMGNQGKLAQLKSVARDLVGHMNLARTGAIRDGRPWAIQFNPGGRSYVILSDSGEPFAPADPADPLDWTDGDETPYRSVQLPANIAFGGQVTSVVPPYNDVDNPDGVTYANDRIIFNPNGTSSESGEVYFTNDPSVELNTTAVSSLAATGRIKFWSNAGTGWSK